MANRSTLYEFDRFEAGLPLQPRGVTEWNGSIPPSHLILMSGKPRCYQSSIEKGHKIAVVADREAGVARFLAFLRALEATELLGSEFVVDARGAERFLTTTEGAGKFFLLEPYEVFLASKKPAEAQCLDLVQKQIPAIAAQVDELVARPPESLFLKAPKWLAEVRKEWNMKLGIGSWGPFDEPTE
ncbi:MAG TPA: hypothetical protein VIU61_06065 [Kofleriaceae bacterium]